MSVYQVMQWAGPGVGLATSLWKTVYLRTEEFCLTSPPLSWVCLGFLGQEFDSGRRSVAALCSCEGSVTQFTHLSMLTRGFHCFCFNDILNHWDLSPTACDGRQESPKGGTHTLRSAN